MHALVSILAGFSSIVFLNVILRFMYTRAHPEADVVGALSEPWITYMRKVRWSLLNAMLHILMQVRFCYEFHSEAYSWIEQNCFEYTYDGGYVVELQNGDNVVYSVLKIGKETLPWSQISTWAKRWIRCFASIYLHCDLFTSLSFETLLVSHLKTFFVSWYAWSDLTDTESNTNLINFYLQNRSDPWLGKTEELL